MITTITASRPTTSRGAVAGIGLVSALVAAAGTAFGAHDWGEIAVVWGAIAVTTVLVFGLVVPKALRKETQAAPRWASPSRRWCCCSRRSGRGCRWCSAWPASSSATPAGRRLRCRQVHRCRRPGRLAAVGYLAIYISDGMNGGAGFLFS